MSASDPVAGSVVPAERAAWLLVNLGTPDAPTAEAVRRYLLQFLSDRRVVQIPALLWQPLLRGIILPRRSAPVAHKYAEIWLPDGSPLAVYTQQLAQAVQQQVPDRHVAVGMRYGQPDLAETIDRLVADGYGRITVLPLYPQYSTTTTASVIDVLQRARAAHPRLRLHGVDDYHRDAGWAGAVADSIRDHWATHGRGERLLFSFHGIPQRVVDGGDPYARHCEASTAAIAEALDMPRGQILLAYQSRFGRERWLQPYTVAVLEQLARDGVRTVDVACPGFAVDCLETLEEIALQNAAAFRAAGGDCLRYIPCLNAAPAHAQALVDILRRAEAACP